MNITTQMTSLRTPAGEMPAYLARPEGDMPASGLIVCFEGWGMNSHIKQVTERFARLGYVSVTPDLYYRHGSRVIPYGDLKGVMEYIARLRYQEVMDDMARLSDFLRAQPNVRSDRIGILGFCTGGRISFLSACHNQDVDAVVSYYGSRLYISDGEWPSAFDVVDRLNAPLLAGFGEADAHIPLETVARFRQALAERRKDYEIITYPEAGHAFVCDERGQESNPIAARKAWADIDAFFRRRLAAEA